MIHRRLETKTNHGKAMCSLTAPSFECVRFDDHECVSYRMIASLIRYRLENAGVQGQFSSRLMKGDDCLLVTSVSCLYWKYPCDGETAIDIKSLEKQRRKSADPRHVVCKINVWFYFVYIATLVRVRLNLTGTVALWLSHVFIGTDEYEL